MAAPVANSLVTRDILQAELAIFTERLRAEMWRAMYMQIGAVTAIVTAIGGIALVLARWVL